MGIAHWMFVIEPLISNGITGHSKTAKARIA
jgi:hypothetical protein